MQTEVVPTAGAGWVEKAEQVLHRGGLVVFPTDTVYGIAADPFNPSAVMRLYRVKIRPTAKAIPLLVGSTTDLGRVVSTVPETSRRLIEAFWPGPLTIVLAKHVDVPVEVSSTPTVGVRMPDHKIASRILQAIGPLAVTSANLSGELEARDASQVLAQLAGKVDLVLNGGVTPGGRPSTVVDCTREPVQVLRQGPITDREIYSILE